MSEKHYLRKLDADMGRAEYDMYRAIPAEEIGWENPAHHMTFAKWREYLQDLIGDEFREKVHPEHENLTYSETSYIMYLEDYPIGLIKLKPRKNGGELDGWAEVSYVIRPVCRGTGLATTMLNLLKVEAQKRGVATLAAFANRHNVASWRTLEKCNFQLVRETEWGSKYYELVLIEEEK